MGQVWSRNPCLPTNRHDASLAGLLGLRQDTSDRNCLGSIRANGSQLLTCCNFDSSRTNLHLLSGELSFQPPCYSHHSTSNDNNRKYVIVVIMIVIMIVIRIVTIIVVTVTIMLLIVLVLFRMQLPFRSWLATQQRLRGQYRRRVYALSRYKGLGFRV